MTQPSQQQIKETLYSSLKELGLTKHEISLYILSLTRGPTSISELATDLQISRPNLYKVIKGLEEHSLAKFSERKKYDRRFSVESPTVVRELLRKKKTKMGDLEESVVTAMPDLLAAYRQGSSDTKVQVIEGHEQFAKTLDTINEQAKDEIQFFGSAFDFIGLVTWPVERRFIKNRVKKGIKINVLTLPGKDVETLAKDDDKELRETRVLKDWPQFPSSFILFANKAFIWQPKAKLALLITDEYIVTMFRAIFNKLWEPAA